MLLQSQSLRKAGVAEEVTIDLTAMPANRHRDRLIQDSIEMVNAPSPYLEVQFM